MGNEGIDAWAGGSDGGRPPSGPDAPPAATPVSDPAPVPPPYERWGMIAEGPGCDVATEDLRQIILVTPQPDGSATESAIGFGCAPRPEDTGPTPTVITPGFVAERAERLFPRPVFEMNPRAYAVTGIETRVWYGDDGTSSLEAVDHDGDPSTPSRPGLSLSVSDGAGVSTVTVTAWLAEYTWEMGDGTTLRSSSPGSEERWADEHNYTETNPENQVRAGVTWHGRYSVAGGPGVTLPPVTIYGEWTDYPVYQVRSAPVARTGG